MNGSIVIIAITLAVVIMTGLRNFFIVFVSKLWCFQSDHLKRQFVRCQGKYACPFLVVFIYPSRSTSRWIEDQKESLKVENSL